MLEKGRKEPFIVEHFTQSFQQSKHVESELRPPYFHYFS